MGSSFETVALYALLAINVFAFLLFVWDLLPFGRGRFEVSEKLVLMVAWCGGAIGALVGHRLLQAGSGTRRFRLMLYMLVAGHLLAIAAWYGLRGLGGQLGRWLGI